MKQPRPQGGMKKNAPVSAQNLSKLSMRLLICLKKKSSPLTSVPGTAGTRGVKRLILRRFPYSVIVHERDTEILVLAFAHHSRRPDYWRDRLRT